MQPQPKYPFGQYLRGLSTWAKIGLALAVGVVSVVLGVWLSNEPWKSQRQKDCETGISSQEYGQDRDMMVQFCETHPLGPPLPPPPPE